MSQVVKALLTLKCIIIKSYKINNFVNLKKVVTVILIRKKNIILRNTLIKRVTIYFSENPSLRQ